MRLPHQYQLGARLKLHQTTKRAEGFGDALIWFQETKNANEWGGGIETEPLAIGVTIWLNNPSAMWNLRHWTFKSPPAQFRFNTGTMNNRAPRAVQDAAQHRDALIIRAAFQSADMLFGVSQRGRPAIVLDFPHIRVPIAATDREIGDEMMQVGFVHHHNPRILECGLVYEGMIRIIAELVEYDVVARRIERSWRAGKCFNSD